MAKSQTWGWVDMSKMDEKSIATALNNELSLIPESTIFGTPVLRAVIIEQHGLRRGEEKKGRQSLAVDLAFKVARYMGGVRWNKTYALDSGDNNKVSDFYDVNDTYKTLNSKNDLWDANLIWVETYNRTKLYYPQFQTVYSDDTSILNNFMAMVAATYLKRICYRTWADLSGKNLTEEQIISESNKTITKAVEGIFHERFQISVNTFLTLADKQRGYSWSCEIVLKGATMRTVGTYTIIADRLTTTEKEK